MGRELDPRWYQIATLFGLLSYGALALDLEVGPARAALVILCALVAQRVCSAIAGRPFEAKSALISGLSLALLLRTGEAGLLALGAVLAISSKFLLRWRGKHVFNPTCFALTALLLASDRVWVSPGRWGSETLFVLAVAGPALLILTRARTLDVALGFLCAYAAGLMARALWLGDPLAIPLHALASGSLLVFAFFMISDPRTIPDARPARLGFALAVAGAALFVEYGLYARNGPFYALAAAQPLVPLLDRIFPGQRFTWTRFARSSSSKETTVIPRPGRAAAVLAVALSLPFSAQAFCGFYVAKADTKLFNRASQVVLVRDGQRTVVTLSNDYQGDPREFAMVIPVPTVLQREQIHVGERAVLEHLDAFTAPRLVEYHDPDPCLVARTEEDFLLRMSPAENKASRAERGLAGGVRIEAEYTVGEYDIVILSAQESRGLARWLDRNGYRLPKGAEPVLESYQKQGLHFFLARVNLGERERLGFRYLRPLQIAYETRKFMLPLRLGTLNANGPQELFVYALSRRGRVEPVNYRTTRVPSDVELPTFIKAEFADFYRAMFEEQVRRERMSSVFLEYAWDMGWCDPCAADPLSAGELRQLGVFWVDAPAERGLISGGGARDVFVTRLHVRYDAEHFPADLVFQETADRTNFQGRYVLRHPFPDARCPAAAAYYEGVRERQQREAEALATLTGWELERIRGRLDLPAPVSTRDAWWERIWAD
jgi:Na+-translocating ferredoxin:NAD+ oxidoreductase RnfD subunit